MKCTHRSCIQMSDHALIYNKCSRMWSLPVPNLFTGVFNICIWNTEATAAAGGKSYRERSEELLRTLSFVDLVSQTAQSHRQELEDQKHTVYTYFSLFKGVISSDYWIHGLCFPAMKVRGRSGLFKWSDHV